MSSADKMRRLFDQAAMQINAAPDDAFFEKIKTMYTRTVQHKATRQEPSMWRSIMKSPSAKPAVAAAVVIACVIGLSLWRTTGSGIALADVLARVEQARSVQWDISGTISSDGAPDKFPNWPSWSTWLFSQEWGQRISMGRTDPNGRQTPLTEICFSRKNKIVVQIDHSSKRYTRTEMDDTTFRRAEEVLSQASDPGRYLRRIMTCKYESMGRSTIDGLEVEGFRTTDPNIGGYPGIIDPQVDHKLWVDVKTRMPVRIEGSGSGVAKMGGRISIHGVQYPIRWDVPVTAAEFEPPAVPSGYLVVLDGLPGPITEEGTIEGLRQCVELLGKYPGQASIALPEGIQSALDGSDSPAAARLKEELKGLTEQDRVNRLMDVGTPMRRVDRFFTALNTQGKDPAYYGKTVTPKDTDKVLLRWKVSDSEYRVIFGDLHAETVSPEKLAELEKALPK